MTDEDRRRLFAHSQVDALIACGLTPSSAFQAIGAILEATEREAGQAGKRIGELHVNKNGPIMVWDSESTS